MFCPHPRVSRLPAQCTPCIALEQANLSDGYIFSRFQGTQPKSVRVNKAAAALAKDLLMFVESVALLYMIPAYYLL